jgi:hypothetical protein
VSDDIDDKFRPVQSHELSDLALLPGQFRQFAAEVRMSFELLTERIMPALDRLNTAIDDLRVRVSRVERERDEDRKALAEIQRELSQRSKRIRARK